ncbi:MAG: polysaccharide deacetylase family protein [Dehalococcoidales bacterium]|nr:polysaccharide deacetylase family protein [Dehalococcoidales bacterium]
MNNNELLTILMYHYVRDLPKTRYPSIKGLVTSNFIGQLDYIQKHYSVINMHSCIEACLGRAELPAKACLLTFDDGFVDHYTTVFPLLYERGISGAFFPSTRPILERKMLDTHKIHYILASTEDYRRIIKNLFAALDRFRKSHKIASNEELYSKLAVASRFDPAEVIFIKRALQQELPEDIRSDVIDTLFTDIVPQSEETLAEELYMTLEQMRLMVGNGMYIGGHGYEHIWMGHASEESQRIEVIKSVELLKAVYGDNPGDWMMSYPYGDWSEELIQILKEHGCVAGLTTEVSIARVLPETKFLLPRLDTNDLPVSGYAPVSQWTVNIQNDNGKE